MKNNIYIKIVIPGSIDYLRRDYDIINNAFLEIDSDIEIIFLGKPKNSYDYIFLNSLKEKMPVNVTLKYFNNYVDSVLFSKIMQNCNYILNISRPEFYFDGKIINSGFVEAVRFNKPLIVHSKFNYYDNYNLNIIHYQNHEELSNFLNTKNSLCKYHTFFNSEVHTFFSRINFQSTTNKMISNE